MGFDPQPYGTAPIDGAEVELFAPAGGSPVLIFTVAALLLLGRRSQFKRALGDRALYSIGAGLLLAGAAIGRWADYVGAPELLIPGTILLLLGSAALLGGRVGLRAMAPPALFLVFAFPIPAGLVNSLVWPLQLSTAATTETFLGLMGLAPAQFGDLIYLGERSFHVIETCSGMRMIETLIMASVLYAMLFYRRPFQAVSLFLVAPVIGYFVNFVRVLSIIFNPYSALGTIHTVQGIVMLVVGVVMIATFDKLLARIEAGFLPSAKVRQVPGRAAPQLGLARPVWVVLFLVVLGTSNLLIPSWQVDPAAIVSAEPRALRLPFELAGSMPRGQKLDRQFLGSVGVTKWLHREYDFMGASVDVQILADDRLNRRGSLVSQKTAVPGTGYSEVTRDVVRLGNDRVADRYVYQDLSQNRKRRTLVYHWYEGTASGLEEVWRNALVLDRGPARRDHWAVALRVSTQVAPDDVGAGLAEARLQGFAEVLRNALR